MLQVDALSLVYIKTQITAYSNGQLVNPTSDDVQMAFSLLPANPSGQPVSPYVDPPTWYSATWETVAVGVDVPLYFARCLVGPGGTFVPPQNGTYYVRVQIFDNPETPVLRCGPFAIV